MDSVRGCSGKHSVNKSLLNRSRSNNLVAATGRCGLLFKSRSKQLVSQPNSLHPSLNIGVRGSPERDISSLPALGPGGGQISRVVHVSARAAFGVFAEKYGFVQEGRTFIEKVWFRA